MNAQQTAACDSSPPRLVLEGREDGWSHSALCGRGALQAPRPSDPTFLMSRAGPLPYHAEATRRPWALVLGVGAGSRPQASLLRACCGQSRPPCQVDNHGLCVWGALVVVSDSRSLGFLMEPKNIGPREANQEGEPVCSAGRALSWAGAPAPSEAPGGGGWRAAGSEHPQTAQRGGRTRMWVHTGFPPCLLYLNGV